MCERERACLCVSACVYVSVSMCMYVSCVSLCEREEK